MTMYKEEFKDYDAKRIAAKLKQCRDFEEKYGECDTSSAWIKWCTDYNYRKREWEWRQAVARAHGKENLIDGFGEMLHYNPAKY